ncbi:MAG TPA: hypothetical protein VMN78_00550 [Longimicrobiales bacterium]|nr:hypothetical protein [Longimicrobiales bacterium]
MSKGIVTLAVTAAALACAAPAGAQDHDGMRHHDLEGHVAHLDEALDLTDDQAARIRSILADVEQRHEAIREGEDHDATHAQMQQLHEQTVARISEVLTAEQRTRLEELHREMMERHQRDHDAHRQHSDSDRR